MHGSGLEPRKPTILLLLHVFFYYLVSQTPLTHYYVTAVIMREDKMCHYPNRNAKKRAPNIYMIQAIWEEIHENENQMYYRKIYNTYNNKRNKDKRIEKKDKHDYGFSVKNRFSCRTQTDRSKKYEMLCVIFIALAHQVSHITAVRYTQFSPMN